MELRLAHAAELLDALQGAALLWLESPSNPKLEVYDLAALAEAARAAGRAQRGGQHHGGAAAARRRSTWAPTSR